MSQTLRVGLGAIAVLLAALVIGTPAWAVPAGVAPLRVAASQDLGPAGGARSLTLVLSSRQPAALRAFIAQRHHPLLTPAQYNARFAPALTTVRSITAWAAAHGLRVQSVSSNRALISVVAPAGTLGRALGTSFHRFVLPNHSTYVSSVTRAVLPAPLARRLIAVLGLSDLARTYVSAHLPAAPQTLARSLLGQASPPVPGVGVPLPARVNGAATPGALPTASLPASYGPQDFWAMYDAPSAQTGSGQQVSVIAEGDVSQAKADLGTFERRFGLPTAAWNQINVGTPSSDTSGADEWDLDTQYSTGLAPGVSQVNVYVAPSMSNPDILSAINRWVSDKASTQASFSAGECESLASVSGFESSLDSVLAQAVAQGQTLFTSSGDTGSQCPALVAQNGVPVGEPGDNYPAASPNAIGVGGTTVLSNSPLQEIGWSAGGGGASLTENAGAYQAGAGGSFTGVSRGVPDVALDADPNSGYTVIVAGQPQTIGGTSASAPAWQGVWARAQGAHGDTLGFAGPVIYATEPAGAFHDITVGANGLYVCTPGWDYLTGRGTPDIAAFVNGA